MERDRVERPEPRWWPEPITVEQYLAFAPAKLELIAGYLIDGCVAKSSVTGTVSILAA